MVPRFSIVYPMWFYKFHDVPPVISLCIINDTLIYIYIYIYVVGIAQPPLWDLAKGWFGDPHRRKPNYLFFHFSPWEWPNHPHGPRGWFRHPKGKKEKKSEFGP
jgi:hypothetical protein